MDMNIKAGTTVGELVVAWLKQLRLSGHLENTTINEYERVLRKLVLPELGTVIRLSPRQIARTFPPPSRLRRKGP